MTNVERIGVGIIGLSAGGGWAATAHLPALRALPGFEVRGLTASSLAAAEAAGRAHGVPNCFGNPQEMVTRDDIQLVVVAVKVPEHGKLVESALRAGKSVYCEWPLGMNADDAGSMSALSDRLAVRGFVGLQARALPTIRYVRDLIASRALGEIISTSLLACDGSAAGKIGPRYAYTLEKANGVSTLTVAFGHASDALCWCLGGFAELRAIVSARVKSCRDSESGALLAKDSPDQVAVAGVLQSGAVASIHYRGVRSRATPFLWEINGTQGDLLISAESGHMQYGQLTLRHSPGPGKPFVDMPVPDTYPQVGVRSDQVSYGVAHAYANLYSDLTAGTALTPTFADAVRHHGFIARVEQAGRIGATTGDATH